MKIWNKFEFVNVGSELYNFIWDDFCSWYIELSKVHLNSDNDIEKESNTKYIGLCIECNCKIITSIYALL